MNGWKRARLWSHSTLLWLIWLSLETLFLTWYSLSSIISLFSLGKYAKQKTRRNESFRSMVWSHPAYGTRICSSCCYWSTSTSIPRIGFYYTHSLFNFKEKDRGASPTVSSAVSNSNVKHAEESNVVKVGAAPRSESAKPPKKDKAVKKTKEVAPSTDEADALPAHNPARLDIRVGKIISVKVSLICEILFQYSYLESRKCWFIVRGANWFGRSRAKDHREWPRQAYSHWENAAKNGCGIVQSQTCGVSTQLMLISSMRGVKSEGMVLAATSSDGTVELLDPPSQSTCGEKVFFKSFESGACCFSWLFSPFFQALLIPFWTPKRKFGRPSSQTLSWRKRLQIFVSMEQCLACKLSTVL